MTFYLWLAAQADRDDPTGDLARDVCRDTNQPAKDSQQAWEDHLWARGAHSTAIETLHGAWKEYETEQAND